MKKKLKIVLLCCIVGLLAWLCLFNPGVHKEAVSAVWSKYVRAIHAGEHENAYSMHSTQFRKQYTFSQFTNFCHITMFSATLSGRVQHFSSAPLLGRASFVVSNSDLLFPVRWEDGIIPSAEMRKEYGTWTIDRITVYAQ